MSIVSPASQRTLAQAAAPRTLSWPFAGGEVRDIGVDGTYAEHVLEPAGPDEVVARVDAVCVCSSDVKIIRMGAKHPLFNARDLAVSPVVLGHEVALTVVDVGRNWRGLYAPGQRLGLQPAMLVEGKRETIGMDLPGGFSQHMRLDNRVLGGNDPYVFPIPDSLSAAAGAMLEPYSCVEAAYRPNSRTTLKPEGTLLIVGRDGGEHATLQLGCRVAQAVLVDAPRALVEWATRYADQVVACPTLDAALGLFAEAYDDILFCGQAEAADLHRLLPRMAVGGLFALIGPQSDLGPVAVDAARIHYHALGFVGAPGPTVDDAFSPERNRFDFRPGGIALILGAGGAMGRIHTHRALGLESGPKVVIATSRKGRRLEALVQDFAPLAKQHGKTLIVVEDSSLDTVLAEAAPEGCDDVVVVAPDVAVVERGARLMRPDGMLVIFSGMPFGHLCPLPLGWVAQHGARFTGSTGSLVEDQLAVLSRVTERGLELTGNLEAVAGFDALPQALEAVMEGRVCGKVAIYPMMLGLPLTPIRDLKAGVPDRQGWTLADESRLQNK